MQYMLIECAGCGEYSFLVREPEYNALPDEPQYFDWNYYHENKYKTYTFLREDEQQFLPDKLYRLYDSIKENFQIGSQFIIPVALRMMVEGICTNKQITGKSLLNKIENLHKDSVISTIEKDILNKLRILGNQSVHEMKEWQMETLGYALDIINHIIRAVYILPKINNKIKVKSQIGL